MINHELIKLYSWFDIQQGICDEMGIEPKYFRRYHEIVGGEYKDLWHVALNFIIPEHMHNDTIVKMYPIERIIPDDLNSANPEDYFIKQVEKTGEWCLPFLKASQKVLLSLSNDELSPIYVEFSW